ncbi:MAG: hypothetical protein V4751_06970 [Pseudomonadota bacterium]
MRILLPMLSLLVLACPQVGFSAEYTLAECNEKTAELNKELPMALDGVTTWMDTTCVEKDDNTLQIVYVNHITNGNDITQNNLEILRPSLIGSWCTGPNLIPILNGVDTINYQYDFKNGQHIGELTFSKAECPATP